MPKTSPLVKINAVKGYGGIVTLCEPNVESRENECLRIMKETGATLIHPFDNNDVISGQGTITLELSEQLPNNFDTLIAPIGGGGLMSIHFYLYQGGLCIGMKGINPKVKLYGAEPLAGLIIFNCSK